MIHQIRFLIACLLSSLLIYGDLYHQVFVDARSAMSLVLVPFRAAAGFPQAAYQNTSDYMSKRETLLQEKAALEAEILKNSARLKTLDFFVEQNNEFRRIINIAQSKQGRWIPAEVESNVSQPLVERIYLNKGVGDGVGVGMGVVDTDGIIGQVVRVDTNTSVVNLLTDAQQWTAAYNERTQLLVLMRGDGSGRLVVEYASKDSDIQEGDRLLAAAGSIFPAGYPVAKVGSVNPGALYLQVVAIPVSQIWDNTILMVYSSDDEEAVADGQSGEASGGDGDDVDNVDNDDRDNGNESGAADSNNAEGEFHGI